MSRKPPLAGMAVVLFCAVQCRPLLLAWLHSPFDHFGWAVFGMWLFPVAFGLFRPGPAQPAEWLPVAAAVCSLTGAALDFNALRNIGLALSLAAFLPWPVLGAVIWAGIAVSWMPVFGFLGSSIGLTAVLVARFGMISVALLLLVTVARSQKALRSTGTVIRARP